MRINDLLESIASKNDEDQEKGLDYDLVDDLVFFMNNDDDTYRRHVYPSIMKCIDRINSKHKTHPGLFKVAVLQSYKNYLKEYDEKDLPDSLDDKVCSEVCKKIHEETLQHAKEGKYKD